MTKEITTFFGRIPDDKHGNTRLHRAIVQRQITIALAQCTAAKTPGQKKALFLADTFPSSKSTSLILAAKTGLNAVAIALISTAGDNTDWLNYKDYLGNTALHYAALMRNNALTMALLEKGADAKIQNKHGDTARLLYDNHLTSEDFAYRYGYHRCETQKHRMHPKSDFNEDYCGTRNPLLSYCRWFMPHIIVNTPTPNRCLTITLAFEKGTFHAGCYKNIREEPSKGETNIADLALWHIQNNEPIMDIRIYNTMKEFMCNSRNDHFEENTSAALYSKEQALQVATALSR